MQIHSPPDTAKICPKINLLLSEIKKLTRFDISSGSPGLPAGISFALFKKFFF